MTNLVFCAIEPTAQPDLPLLNWAVGGTAWVGNAELPDPNDVARRRDVDGGIAVDQQQVSAQSLRDAAAVMEAKGARWFGGCRGQSLQRREAGEDEQLQLAVEAQTVGEAGGGGIGAREDGRAGATQGADGGLRMRELQLRTKAGRLNLRFRQNFGERRIFEHRHDGELHDIAPHQRKLEERFGIVGLD